jgi:hypothetical protein
MYNQELIDTLATHPNIEMVWFNEDKSIWYFQEVEGFTPIKAADIISGKQSKK